MALKWGTDHKVQFIEPTYNFPMEIGASGEMSLKIKDTTSFLIRLVGTETALTPEGLTKYFRALLMTRVKSYLARTIKERKLNIFEIDSQLDILSDAIKEKLVIDFGEYGIELKQFFISTVVRPEEDEGYRRLKQVQQQRYTDVFAAQTQQQLDMIQMQTDAQRRIMEAQSIAEKRKIEGYTYQEERSFDVAEKVAQNENVGQFTNMGIGMGMMAGIGGSIGSSVGSMVENAMNTTQNMTGIAAAVPPQMRRQPQLQEAAAGKDSSPGENRTRTCSCGAVLPANAKFCFEVVRHMPLCCPGCGSEISPGCEVLSGMWTENYRRKTYAEKCNRRKEGKYRTYNSNTYYYFCGCISDIRKTCRNYGKIPCNMALYSDSGGTVQFIWYRSTIGQQTEYHAESCYRSDCGSISYCICHSKHCT